MRDSVFFRRDIRDLSSKVAREAGIKIMNGAGYRVFMGLGFGICKGTEWDTGY